MSRIKLAIAFLFFTTIVFFPFEILKGKLSSKVISGSTENADNIYEYLDLKKIGLDAKIFNTAMAGHQKLVSENKLLDAHVISIVDLSQPSTNKRLYIIDLLARKVLFNTYVSHGKNSGDLYANHFSNTPSSLQSSLGFYVTGETYEGKHGKSLQLFGQEPGFNDQAFNRSIVIHGADYVSERFIKTTGRLGRSFGCPAVAQELIDPIIKTIEDGSCLFVYFPDPNYLTKSLLACNGDFSHL